MSCHPQLRQHHPLRLLALEVPLILLVLLGCGATSSIVVPTPTAHQSVAIAPRAGSLVGFDGGSTQIIAFIDTAGHIRLLSYQATANWQASDLTQIAGAPVAEGSALAAFYNTSSDTRNLAYTDMAGDIVLLSSAAGGTWQSIKPGQTEIPPQPAPTSSGAAIAAAYNPNVPVSPTDVPMPTTAIYYLAQNGHAFALSDVSAPGTVEWSWFDLSSAVNTAALPLGPAMAACAVPPQTVVFGETATSNLILVNSGITLGGPMQSHALACLYWQADHSLHAFYLNSSGDLTELFVPHLQSGGNPNDAAEWHSSDWSSQASAPRPAGPFAAFQFTSSPAQPEEVAYIDGNGHVQLFEVDNNVYKVTVSDVTQRTQAPLAGASQGLAAYEWVSGASEHIVYVDGQHHLQELSLTQGGAWTDTDLTASTHLVQ